MWDSPRLLNLFALAIAVAAAAALLAGVAVWSSRRPMFSLRAIRIESLPVAGEPAVPLRHVSARRCGPMRCR